MMLSAPSRSARLSLREATSIELAVSQWLRNRQVASQAVRRLQASAIPHDEIERNRRADSADPELRSLLAFAVTVLITRGNLTTLDRARLASRFADATAEIVDAVCSTYRQSVTAAAFEMDLGAPLIDMKIGDY